MDENYSKVKQINENPVLNFNQDTIIRNNPDLIIENYKTNMRDLTANVEFTTGNRYEQKYTNFNDLDMSKSQISHNQVQRIIDSATKFNQKLRELGERRNLQMPTNEDDINFNTNAIPSSITELYGFK